MIHVRDSNDNAPKIMVSLIPPGQGKTGKNKKIFAKRKPMYVQLKEAMSVILKCPIRKNRNILMC